MAAEGVETRRTVYKTSLEKYSAVLKTLDSFGETGENRTSLIRNKLKLSNEELNETLDFLQYIGAIREENRRFLVTSYGKQMLTRIESASENAEKPDDRPSQSE